MAGWADWDFSPGAPNPTLLYRILIIRNNEDSLVRANLVGENELDYFVGWRGGGC